VCDLAAGGCANVFRNELPNLKNLLGPGKGRVYRLGHRHAAPCGLGQLMAKRLLEFARLGADGIERNAQPLGRAGEAASLVKPQKECWRR